MRGLVLTRIAGIARTAPTADSRAHALDGPSPGGPGFGVPVLSVPRLSDTVLVDRCNSDARISGLGRNRRRMGQRAPGGDVLPGRFEQLADAFTGRAGDGMERQAEFRG